MWEVAALIAALRPHVADERVLAAIAAVLRDAFVPRAGRGGQEAHVQRARDQARQRTERRDDELVARERERDRGDDLPWQPLEIALDAGLVEFLADDGRGSGAACVAAMADGPRTRRGLT